MTLRYNFLPRSLSKFRQKVLSEMIGAHFFTAWSLLSVTVFVVAILAGCQLQPTKLTDNIGSPAAHKMAVGDMFVAQETVILETRSSFEFSAARIPGSYLVSWSDYTQPFSEPTAPSKSKPESSTKPLKAKSSKSSAVGNAVSFNDKSGWLQKDTKEIARRLARYGISKSSPVIVVGSGHLGKGEEGRVAWMLKYLGVDNVVTSNFASYRGKTVSGTDQPQYLKTVADWGPELNEALVFSRDQMAKHLSDLKSSIGNPEKSSANQKTGQVSDHSPLDIKCIDVAVSVSENKVDIKDGAKQSDAELLNCKKISWKHFFTEAMKPQKGVVEELASLGIKPSDKVIVISLNGIESSAAALALQAQGFTSASSYLGGWSDLP
jgi:thiosulfate/3-mercaptopyruvate sulfurtransferase